MSYVSIPYYIMVVLAVVLYYAFPKKIRWMVLLLASGCFYYAVSERKEQLVMFGISIVLSYYSGILLQRGRDRKYKNSTLKMILTAGIIASGLPLLVSKCAEFFLGSVLHKPLIHWILPVGLSFYSLQTIGYLVDVYRAKMDPQKNIFRYTLFVSFFPLIIQGPISRYDQLGKQLFEGHDYDSQRLMRGIQLILWGWMLKYLIADKASVFVNAVFDHSAVYSGVFILVAAVLYSIQLYTDFLSCVTMSQGVAELFGIELTDNFNHPYFSTSINDFWKRWHKSLSAWLRDYIYIPLGGNRKGKLRQMFNMLAVWLLTGLWHGANWNFIAWGLLLFLILSIEKAGLLKLLERWKLLGHLYMCFLIPVSWALFGITNPVQLRIYMLKLFPFFAGSGAHEAVVFRGDFEKYIGMYGIGLVIGLICCTGLVEKIFIRWRNRFWMSVLLLIVFGASVFCMYRGLNDPFLYYRF